MKEGYPPITLSLPDWVAPLVADRPGPLLDDTAGMGLAVALAAENVRRGSGGPFGAVIVDAHGGVVAPGVNCVEPAAQSWAHAEMVAVALAQGRLGHHDLSTHPAAPLTLYSSGEPCAMCLGALPWSGVATVVTAAREVDITAIGFDEGDKPAGGLACLARHGISVRTDVLRAEARAVLEDYVARGGKLYHP